jgi:seryl-tRNA synthetase
MSRDFDDIRKKIDQSHKDLYKQDLENSKDIDSVKKNQDKLLKDINEIKKEVKDIGFKVDTMLEILNNFTIMLTEEEEQDEYMDDYADDDESWVPDQEEDWNSYDDEE